MIMMPPAILKVMRRYLKKWNEVRLSRALENMGSSTRDDSGQVSCHLFSTREGDCQWGASVGGEIYVFDQLPSRLRLH
jgi:hypothetical protein